jgi:AAA+ ATPase superfamily predicted ATPase
MQTFYNREEERELLQNISLNLTKTKGQLSVVVGKRRVGKTRLLHEAYNHSDDNKTLYLFVSRKTEPALVEEFTDLIANQLGAQFFRPRSLKEIIEFLLDYSTSTPLTLIIDEFQDIQRVNPSLFSDIQNLWDTYKTQAMMHLICCGSMYSLMNRIFKGADEPLMNRDDYFFKIKPLKPSYIRSIMLDTQNFNAEAMLQWWCLSGGIPKYLEWLSRMGSQSTSNRIFEQVIAPSSPFLKEGLHRLVEDFGSEHPVYFDILSAISRGYTSRSQIQSVMNMDVSIALEKLEKDYDVIAKQKPISSKPTSRDSRFSIEDPFLKFWFHFVHRNHSALEMDNYAYVHAHLARDFETYSGWELEGLFKAVLAESGQFNQIGGYWDPKGKNEIDIVAINELEKKVLIAEVKRNPRKYNPNTLIEKSQELIKKMKLHNYEIHYKGLSLENLEDVMDGKLHFEIT